MKIVYSILSTILFFSSISAQDRYDKQMPKDFSFTISDDINQYNSANGIYTRRYLSKDSSIKVELTTEEIKLIYGLFKKYDFMSFPKEFECDSNGMYIMPAFSTTIKINYKTAIKQVTNSNFCNKKIDQIGADNFDKFSAEIKEILRKKSLVKKMKETDLIFE